MIVELHILQNFAPSCLNRDDTNSPKECQFGGYRRARISSQCIKRAIRESNVFKNVVQGREGVRTKQLIIKIREKITDKQGEAEEVNKIVTEIFNEAGLSLDKKLRTDVLVFIDKQAIEQIAQLIKSKLPDLQKGTKEARKEIIDELSDAVEALVKTPDISLFGRMLAVKPESPLGKKILNIDAACQVAHAISTHKVGREFDFYTAVDDLQKEGDTGAGMMGDIEFNSACYYRYANIDLKQLKDNLGGDEDLAKKAVEAFIRAAVNAIPTGKKTTFAQQNPPEFVSAVVRNSSAWSLANAFSRPVVLTEKTDLVKDSVNAIVDYWGRLSRCYGSDDLVSMPAFTTEPLVELTGFNQVSGLEELVEKVNQAIANA